MQLHGGTIEAASEGPGRGSEFSLRLPLPGDAPDTAVAAAPGGEAPVPARARLLVADDNRDAADTLGMLLEMKGYDVRVAYDGRGALALAQEFRPSVVLLDIGMPDLSGYEVARALREKPWGGALLVIALTGWGQDSDRQRAQDAGFDWHLTKPVDPDALQALIASRSAGQEP
jgi:CheY-like chemotaxis protein